jgi:hypothetical protein
MKKVSSRFLVALVWWNVYHYTWRCQIILLQNDNNVFLDLLDYKLNSRLSLLFLVLWLVL